MADHEFLTLHLEIGLGDRREYPVIVRASPAGPAQGRLHFPFSELALQDYLQALQFGLPRPDRQRPRPAEREQAIQDLGSRLFETLFRGEVLRCYDASRKQAAEQDKGLRLALAVEPPELAALPWEFLHDPRRNEYVCLSPRVSLVRSIAPPEEGDIPTRLTLPLRILGLVVAPSDWPALAAETEKQRLEAALGPLLAQGLVELEWVVGGLRRDLQRAIWQGDWHVFHFVGHGGFDAGAGQGFVVLADAEGQGLPLSASRLGRLLIGCQELRLVVLAAGQGTRAQFSQTAIGLVQQGLPGVLAVEAGLTEQAALGLNRAFYEALVASRSLEEAVGEGRAAIRSKVAQTLEWGVAALYTSAPEWRLLDNEAHVALALRLGEEALADDDFEGAISRFALAAQMGAGQEARERQLLADEVRGGLLAARETLKALSGASEDQAEAILQVIGDLEGLQRRLPASRAVQIELARARERASLLRDRLWAQGEELMRGRAVGLTLGQRRKRVEEAIRLLEKAKTLDWDDEPGLQEELVSAQRRLDYLQKAAVKSQASRRRRLLLLGAVGAALAGALLVLGLVTDLVPLPPLGLGGGTAQPPVAAPSGAATLAATEPAAQPTDTSLPTLVQSATAQPARSAEPTIAALPATASGPTAPPPAADTATPQPSATAAPSRTPLPTATPTATTPPTETAAAQPPTLPKTDTPTPTPTSTPTPTPGIIYPAPVLIEPEDTSLLSQSTFSTYPFEWTWDGALQADEWFDVRVWQPGRPHYGIAWTKELSYLYDLCLQGSGDYLWSIAVVRGQEGQWQGDLSPEATPHRFTSSRSDVWCDRHGRFSLPARGGPQ